MDEVGSALIAIALVLCAVFVPAAFITGISGQFYRQFALTIAGATIISLIVSLTLSPAHVRAAAEAAHERRASAAGGCGPCTASSRLFNRGFEALARGYGWLTARMVRFAVLMLVVYAGVIAFGLNEFRKTPAGFIPQLDAGYLIVVTQLPGGASLARTDAVNRRVVDIAPCRCRASPTPSTSRASRAPPSPTPPTRARSSSSSSRSRRGPATPRSPPRPSRARCSSASASIQEGLVVVVACRRRCAASATPAASA